MISGGQRMAKGKNDVLAAGGRKASFSVPKVTQEEWDRVFRGVPRAKVKSKPPAPRPSSGRAQ